MNLTLSSPADGGEYYICVGSQENGIVQWYHQGTAKEVTLSIRRRLFPMWLQVCKIFYTHSDTLSDYLQRSLCNKYHT